MAFLKQKSSTTTLVSAKLPEAAKVEYIEYSIDGGTNPNYVNINSPFILDDSDDAIKEFNVFLPFQKLI